MRWLTRLVIAAGLIWGGYWFVGSKAVRSGAEAWFATQPDASYQTLSVQGFPNRFDLTITEPRLTDPASGLGWQAPFVQVFSLSYRPWHLIAAFAPEQVLTIGDQTFGLRAEKLQASLVMQPQPALPLDRLALAGDGLVLELPQGYRLDMAKLQFASRADPGAALHEVALDLTGASLAPANALAGVLPDTVDSLTARATVSLTAPLDRFAAQSRPQIAALTLQEATLRWGTVALFAKGELLASPAGVATGQMSLRIDGWQTLLDAAARLGVIDARALPGLTRTATFLALASGDPGVIELPLSFTDTGISLAGFPVAPPLWLR